MTIKVPTNGEMTMAMIDLVAENKRLEKQVITQAERIAAQSELLKPMAKLTGSPTTISSDEALGHLAYVVDDLSQPYVFRLSAKWAIEEIETLKRHWIEDDRDLNELIAENERLKKLTLTQAERIAEFEHDLYVEDLESRLQRSGYYWDGALQYGPLPNKKAESPELDDANRNELEKQLGRQL